MVTQIERFKAQQQAFRRVQLSPRQKLQQQALRTGKSIAEIERERAIIQREQQIKEAKKRQKEELIRITKEVKLITEDISKGKIISESQIPQEYKPYLNIPKDYFQKQQKYLEQKKVYEGAVLSQSAYQEALKHYEKGVAGAYIFHMKSSESPQIALVKEYLVKMISWRKYYKDMERRKRLGVIDVKKPEAPLTPTFSFFEPQITPLEQIMGMSIAFPSPYERFQPPPISEVQPLPKQTFYSKFMGGAEGYFRGMFPGVRTPREVGGVIISGVKTFPEDIKETGRLLVEPIPKVISTAFELGKATTIQPYIEKYKPELYEDVIKVAPIPFPTSGFDIPTISEKGVIREATPKEIASGKKGITYLPYQEVHDKKVTTLEEATRIGGFAFKVEVSKIEIKKERKIEEIQKKHFGEVYSEKVYQYSKDELDKESITWEEATKRFEKSPEGKRIQAIVEKEWKAFLKKLKKEEPLLTTASRFGLVLLDLIPKTAGEAGLTAGALYLAGGIGWGTKTTLGFVYHKPIMETMGIGIEQYEKLPRAETRIGGVVKGVGIGLLAGTTIGTAYATELGKGLITDPYETTSGLIEWGVEKPEEVLGLMIGGGIKKIYKKKVQTYKQETKSYEVAKQRYNELKRVSKTADITYPSETVSLGVKIIDIKIEHYIKRLKIHAKFVPEIKSIEISQSTAKVVQKRPVMEKIPIPKLSPLYKTMKFRYETYFKDVTRFKNTVSYTFTLKDGSGRTYNYVTFSKKALPRFRSFESALKYGSGKKLVIVKPSEVKGIFVSELYGYRAGKYKPEATYLSKMQDIMIGGEKKLGVVTKKRGKVYDIYPEISMKELFKVSPRVGEAIITKVKKPLRKQYIIQDTKDVFSFAGFEPTLTGIRAIVRTRNVVIDTSVAKQVLAEAFRKSGVKIKPRIIDLRNKVTSAIKKGDKTITISSKDFNKLDVATQNSLITAGVVATIPITPTIKIKTPPQPKLDLKLKGVSLDLSSVMLGAKEIVKTKQQLKLKEEEKIKTKQIVAPIDLTKTISFQKLTPLQRQAQIQKPMPKIKLTTQQITIPKLDFVVTPFVSPTITSPPPPPTPTKLKIPPIIIFGKKPKQPKIKVPKVFPSYNVIVKSKGKQRKVTQHPLARPKAIDLGSYLVDKTLSAEFSLRGSSKKPKQPKIKVPVNYWKLNAPKFRDYRIKKGKQIPLINKWIEKKPQRLDTPGEIKGITVSRLLKQQKRKSLNIVKTSKALNKVFGMPNMFR